MTGKWQSQVQALGLCNERVHMGASSDYQTVPPGGLKAQDFLQANLQPTALGLPSENLLGAFRVLPREQYESPWNPP